MACISGLANFSPEGVSLIWRHFRDGSIEKSKAAQDFISDLSKDLYAVVFASAAVKKAAVLLGEDVGKSRYPIVFSAQDIVAIRQLVEKYGIAPKL